MRHHDRVTDDPQIRPTRSLVLLSVAHAVNHAQAVVLPQLLSPAIVLDAIGQAEG